MREEEDEKREAVHCSRPEMKLMGKHKVKGNVPIHGAGVAHSECVTF